MSGFKYDRIVILNADIIFYSLALSRMFSM